MFQEKVESQSLVISPFNMRLSKKRIRMTNHLLQLMSVKRTLKKNISKLTEKFNLTMKIKKKTVKIQSKLQYFRSSLQFHELKAFLRIEIQLFTSITKNLSRKRENMEEDKAK